MKYRAYNKREIIRAMKSRRLSGSAPSILDVSKWPQWWETGAKELEKTAPGRLITAPIRLPETVVSSTMKTVREVPEVVKTVRGALPLILVAAVVLGGGFLVYKLKKGNKNFSLSDCT